MKRENNQTIINNAISSYLMFFISIMFLFQKNNPNINNSFVKNHTKSAILLHFLIALSLILFKYFNILGNISNLNFLWYSIDNILLKIILIILFWFLFLWIYKAHKWEEFSIWEIYELKSGKNFFDINKNWNLDEKNKLTLILSYIPFVWQIISSKYNNEIVKNILNLNIFITLVISLIFINNHNNLVEIFSLIYLIFIAFVWVNLVANSTLINLNLSKYFSFSELYKIFKVVIIYLKKYFSGNFEEFKIILKNFEEKELKINQKNFENLKNLEDLKWPKKIIYLPIINLFFIFYKENKYKIHIRNGLIISFLAIFIIFLNIFNFISLKILILLLFPIASWIWNLEKIYYKIPLIYDIYELFTNLLKFFKKSKKFISEKKKEVKEETLKVWEK